MWLCRKKYVTVAGITENNCGDRYFYEELEDGVRYLVTQKLEKEFTAEDYAKGLSFKLDHFAPGYQGEPVKGYLLSVPRIDALNAKYGGGFYLFFRTPAFSQRDERYMGWERKRGALTELVRLLKGKHTGLTVKSGEKGWLRQVKYVITLDSDTSLNVGTARELAGAMLHPLNQPVIDPKRRLSRRPRPVPAPGGGGAGGGQ